MDALKFVRESKKGNIDIVENIHRVIEFCEKQNKKYNHFNTICKDEAIAQAKAIKKKLKDPKFARSAKLAGLPISAKDSICVKDVETTGGSAILKGYKPPFDATAIAKVKQAGGIIIGKTAMDEFGFGSFSTHVGRGMRIPKNPVDPDRACGGSSGGAAGITKLLEGKFAHIAIGESTGGSIVCPASFCGTVGMCPTYGLVSRYGLLDYGSSLDKLGPLSTNTAESAFLLKTMSGHDPKDSTSANVKVDFNSNDKLKIGVIREDFKGIDPQIKKQVEDSISLLDSNGVKCADVELPTVTTYGLYAYYIIAMAEASTNLAKYCGMRYGAPGELKGNFNDYFTQVRTDNLGDEAKRRIMIGTFVRMLGYRDAYYIKAMQVRTKIIQEYKKTFKKYDLLLSPTMSMVAPRFDEIDKLRHMQLLRADQITAPPNLAGLPHLSLPCGNSKGKMPMGVMFTADHFSEGKLFQIGSLFEQIK